MEKKKKSLKITFDSNSLQLIKLMYNGQMHESAKFYEARIQITDLAVSKSSKLGWIGTWVDTSCLAEVCVL